MSVLTFPGIKLDERSLALRKRLDEMSAQLDQFYAYMGTLGTEERQAMLPQYREGRDLVVRLEKQIITL